MAATRLCCSRSVAICSIRLLFKPPSSISYAGVYRNSSNDGSGEESRRRDVNRYAFPTVLCIGAIATLKDVLGIERIELDKHPLKNKIKQSMYYRKYNRFDEAIQVLNEAMVEAQESKDPMFVTRVLDELANTYYEMSDLGKAEDLFKTIIQRLIQMHGKNESSPEFIGISLKLADIFARRGQLENAETGYKHCVSKQLQVLEDHKRKHLIEKGAYMEERSPVDAFGPAYTDPYVLFAMALEAYSYFLLDSFGGERVAEVEEYMDEVLKVLDEISNHVYGTCSPHSVNVINNIGARCVIAKQFKLARKYLEVGINRVLNFNECTPILVGYYCNYAEALFHTGDEAKAVEYARRAELFSRSLEDSRVRKYAERFRRDLERDARRAGVRVPASAAASTTTVNIDKNVGDDKSGDGDGGDRRSGWRRWIPI